MRAAVIDSLRDEIEIKGVGGNACFGGSARREESEIVKGDEDNAREKAEVDGGGDEGGGEGEGGDGSRR